MRILFIAGRELEYSRNAVLLRAFRRLGQVDPVGVQPRPASLLLNSLHMSLRALPRLVTGRYDLVFTGFYGHLIMLPVGLLARQPVLFDAFVSTFDTLSADRQVVKSNSLAGRLAFWLDRTACRLADHVLLDTPRHAAYFQETFDLPRHKLSDLPVGCNEDLFYPQALDQGSEPGITRVLYYSSYLPLHGAATVIRAAALVRHLPLHFRLIGAGQEYAPVRRLAQELDLPNVQFVPPVPLANLPEEIARAGICLGGHFGGSEKAGRVVPGKIYQILAMGRPLVAGDTPANRDLLVDGEHALLVPPEDPQALAGAIQALHADLVRRERIACAGRQQYEARCSEREITRRLQTLLERLGLRP